MVTRKFNSKKAGSGEPDEPRLLSEVLKDYFEGDSPMARAYRNRLFEDVFPHTEPCCQLKLLTRQRGRLNEGSILEGVISRSGDEKYFFVEKAREKMVKTVRRTPVIYSGCCVNVHRCSDGSLRLDFNRPRFDSNFSFRDFCLAAAQELLTISRLLGEE